MNINQAQQSIKNLQVEASKLSQSALIDLFEIDLSNIAEQRGISVDANTSVFRFHNAIKLLSSKITYNGNEFVAAPIQAEGFSVSSQGVLPTPVLRLVINDEAIPLLALLKQQIRFVGDLVGCKVTRHRVFAAFLHVSNFNENNTPNNLRTDEFSSFPPTIFFINRKTRENKFIIEYELASVLDVEGVNLPKRQLISKRCNYNYRGEGCLYEKNARRNDDIHGEFAILPNDAPPVATDEDKLIKDILGLTNLGADKGQFNNQIFNIGDYCYIQINGIKYYFVAKLTGQLTAPPNTTDWIADKCSKCSQACKFRWDSDGAANVIGTSLIKGQLPFGGFPSLERLRGNA